MKLLLASPKPGGNRGAIGASLPFAATRLSQATGDSLSARAELCRQEVAGRRQCLLSSGWAQSQRCLRPFLTAAQGPCLNLFSCVLHQPIAMRPGPADKGGFLSTFGFCLLLVHPEGRVGIGNGHRLCGQADLGLHSGSVVHYITTSESLTRSLFPPLEHGGSPSSCTGL